jgi:hypothetical protein
MRWPVSLQKRSKSSNGSANSIPRFAFPISVISCRHFAEGWKAGLPE